MGIILKREAIKKSTVVTNMLEKDGVQKRKPPKALSGVYQYTIEYESGRRAHYFSEESDAIEQQYNVIYERDIKRKLENKPLN